MGSDPVVSFVLAGLEIVAPELRGGARAALHSTSLFPLYRIQTNRGELAAKVMRDETMARTEAAGLATLAEAGVRTPAVLGIHAAGGRVALFMEFIAAAGPPRRDDLLKNLSKLYTRKYKTWGFDFDNFIGSLPQPNGNTGSFAEFWWTSRIKPQARAAVRAGLLRPGFATEARKLVERLSAGWNLDRPGPRLVHGDLWSGNLLAGADGTFFIDPSPSRAHPEQDFAMLELFGSPLQPSDFAALGNELGLDPDYEERRAFWQLYPLLVHVNIFGRSYAARVEAVLRAYV